jgi:hypothetical protein
MIFAEREWLLLLVLICNPVQTPAADQYVDCKKEYGCAVLLVRL